MEEEEEEEERKWEENVGSRKRYTTPNQKKLGQYGKRK